jgi:hypothetical protein
MDNATVPFLYCIALCDPLDSGDIYIYVSLSVSASLTAYAIHPQQLGGIKLILQQIFVGEGEMNKDHAFFFSPTHF